MLTLYDFHILLLKSYLPYTVRLICPVFPQSSQLCLNDLLLYCVSLLRWGNRLTDFSMLRVHLCFGCLCVVRMSELCVLVGVVAYFCSGSPGFAHGWQLFPGNLHSLPLMYRVIERRLKCVDLIAEGAQKDGKINFGNVTQLEICRISFYFDSLLFIRSLK